MHYHTTGHDLDLDTDLNSGLWLPSAYTAVVHLPTTAAFLINVAIVSVIKHSDSQT